MTHSLIVLTIIILAPAAVYMTARAAFIAYYKSKLDYFRDVYEEWRDDDEEDP